MADFQFLRRVFALDAVSTVACGLVLVAAADALAPVLGYPTSFVRGAGLLMLPLAAFIGWLATRPVPPTPLVWVVIIGNFVWMAESFLVLKQFGGAITSTGVALTIAQAGWVALMGGLEFAGLRRGRLAAA